MTLTISQLISYRPTEVRRLAESLRADLEAYDTVALGLRDNVGRALDGLGGDTVEAINDNTEDLAKHLMTIGDEFVRLAGELDAFAAEIETARTRIFDAQDAATAAGCQVTDTGDVIPPTGIGHDDALRVAHECAQTIKDELERVDTADKVTAVRMIGAFVPPKVIDKSGNDDPTAALAGGSIGVLTDPISALLAATAPNDPLYKVATGTGKIFPMVGAGTSLAIGMGTAPDEPVHETIITEVAGSAASLATSAFVVTGGETLAATTFAPPPARAALVAAGALLGAGAGYLTTRELRNHFDEAR